MKKMKLSKIKELVKMGLATDITESGSKKAIGEQYDKVGYSIGTNGVNGYLLKGESGKYYAITKRTMLLDMV